MIRAKRTRQVKFISEINITPFTDVCLVLLIIFMVTAPAMIKESNFHLNLPKAVNSDTVVLPSNVTVRITHEGAMYVNDTPVTHATLADAIAKVHAEKGARLLIVKADEAIPYREVINVIDVARSVGVDKIGLYTRKVEKPEM
jgi:biopolymer transport protein ExbD